MIKLFEEFGENTFYPIDNSGVIEMMKVDEPLENFTDKEIRVLHKYYQFVEYTTNFRGGGLCQSAFDGLIVYYSEKMSGLHKRGITDIRCYKMPDEWYLIWILKVRNNEYYMCDQLRGLEDCLKMIKEYED